jgi:hypothetical protein
VQVSESGQSFLKSFFEKQIGIRKSYLLIQDDSIYINLES